LNAIAAAPGQANSYIPSISLDMSILPNLFSQVTAY